MKIHSITIKNYKGFVDSGPIAIGRNWTVVVGKNSVGKTALLECLGLREFSNKVHRSPKLPFEKTADERSHLQFTIGLSGKEMEEAFLQHRNRELWIPFPDRVNGKQFCESFFSTEAMIFTVGHTPGDWYPLQSPSHGLFEGPIKQSFRLRTDQHRPEWGAVGPSTTGNDTLAPLAGQVLAASCYAFKAERRVLGTAQIQEHMHLSSDASNLAGALHYFFNNNSRQFQRYLALVRRVIPSVEHVDAPPISSTNVRVRVWHTGYEDERPDLAIPLDDCGTGIQAL